MKRNLFRSMTVGALLAIHALTPLCLEVEAGETIRINGSGSGLSMLKPLISAYRKANPDSTIIMEKPLGSTGAIKALLAGALDIVASSKPLKNEEAAKGAVISEYGKTPLVIVTEKSVKKSNITTRELEDIYAGRTGTWSNGEKIRIILRPAVDIDTVILRSISEGMNNAIDTARSQHGMIVAVTDPEASTMIARTKGAIGTTTVAGQIDEKLALNVMSLNGVKATIATLADGSYPLGKDIRFITTAKTGPEARKFMEFVYSSQGRAMAAKAGVLISDKARLAR